MINTVIDVLLASGIVLLATAALLTRSSLRSIVWFVCLGLLTAICWARLDAWDIALAEAAIGSGISGVLLLLAWRRLHRKPLSM